MKLKGDLLDIDVPVISSEGNLRMRGSVWFIVATVAVSIFSDIFLYGVIVPVVPFAFRERMNVEESVIQTWVSRSLSAYSGGLFAGSIVFGCLCDRMGNRRSSMLIGLLLSIVTVLMICFTKVLAVFMLARVLQGISAAIVWTVGMAIVADTAPPGKTGTLMGYPAIGIGFGRFIGPTLGGIIYDRAGYYAVFGFCLGLLSLDVIMRLLMIERKTLRAKLAKRGLSLDEDNSVDSTGPESNDNSASASTPKDYIARWKGHKIPPMILLLKYPRVLTVMFQTLTAGWVSAVLDAATTIHLEELFGFNSMYAGLMLLTLSIPILLDPLAGWAGDRYGTKYVMTSGFMLACPALVLLRVPDENSTGQIVLFAAILTLFGIAFCIFFAPLMAELTGVIAEIEESKPGIFGPNKGYGQAYGLQNISLGVGSLIGPFHATAAVNSGGWNLATLTSGIIMGVTVIPTLLFTGGDIIKKWRQNRHSHSSVGAAPVAAPAP